MCAIIRVPENSGSFLHICSYVPQVHTLKTVKCCCALLLCSIHNTALSQAVGGIELKDIGDERWRWTYGDWGEGGGRRDDAFNKIKSAGSVMYTKYGVMHSQGRVETQASSELYCPSGRWYCHVVEWCGGVWRPLSRLRRWMPIGAVLYVASRSWAHDIRASRHAMCHAMSPAHVAPRRAFVAPHRQTQRGAGCSGSQHKAPRRAG